MENLDSFLAEEALNVFNAVRAAFSKNGDQYARQLVRRIEEPNTRTAPVYRSAAEWKARLGAVGVGVEFVKRG